MTAFVDVAVPVGIHKTFAYSVPDALRDRATAGVRALVPFGRKLVTGFIVGGSDVPPAGSFEVRPIRELLDAQPLIPRSLVRTALWIADYYFTPPGEVFKAVVPAGTQVSGARKADIRPGTLKLITGGLRPPGLDKSSMRILETLASEGALLEEQISEKTGLAGVPRRIDALAAAGHVEIVLELARARVDTKEQLVIRARPPEGAPDGLPAAQERLYEVLVHTDAPLLLQDALRAAGCTAGVAKALSAKGLADIAPAAIERVPADLKDVGERKLVTLTPHQQEALAVLRKLVSGPVASRCLLHGVTGSGKTEVYLRLIADVLQAGNSALLLVPEIGLTPLLSRIAVSHFQERVALLHSGMSAGERFDQWHRIRSGRGHVVVGTRSAVFAPLDDIRLIVIDEEQDGSYKQDEPPCYHAREVAWHRLSQSGGLLLLGSATPAIETFHASQDPALMRRLVLPERIRARPLARVTVVDMGQEFQRTGKRAILSSTLEEELRDRVRKQEQCIILLNRRGYSRTLFCRSCGHVFTCPDCSVSMTYHQGEARLVCHYCGMEKQTPSACAQCGGPYIYFVGIGTEQLEQVVRNVVPSARVARVDRDTTRRRGALRKMLFDFAAGDLDVLVGTQMLAKGHDFPNVTLVGVLAADADLAFPDFRSAERTFQLLTQVAGRAGRGASPGHVVIQSLYPDHYAIRFARRQDYEAFYRQEIEYRQVMGYPPFRSLAQVLVTNENNLTAFQIGERIVRALKHASESRAGNAVRVLGPAPAPLEKLRGQYRVQVLVKAPDPVLTSSVLRAAFDELAAQQVPLKAVHVDVDPLSLL